MNNKNRVILVLGVHRSGTSALTKGLEAMGISLGTSLIPPNIFNEKGYWEDVDFHELNLEMLDSFESRLRRILPLSEEEAVLLCERGFLTKASQLLLKKLPSSQPLGIKDPRFSILLPFWKKVFKECNVDASFVIALRNPLSVAACQEQFQNQHREKSFWIWISYLLTCLEHSEGNNRILVDYDELLKNPKHQIQRIARTLALDVSPELLQAYCFAFIDPSLRHFYGEKDTLLQKNFCRAFALEMYEKFLAVARDEISFKELQDFSQKWKAQFSPLESLLALEEKNNLSIQNLIQTNQQLHKTNTERLKTIIELNKTIMEKFNFVTELHQAIEQRDRHIALLTQKNK